MSESIRHSSENRDQASVPSNWLNLVRAQVAGLRFGTVIITVHDSKVVQVEISEKVRVDPSGVAQGS